MKKRNQETSLKRKKEDSKKEELPIVNNLQLKNEALEKILKNVNKEHNIDNDEEK